MKRTISLAALLGLGALSVPGDEVFFYDQGARPLSVSAVEGGPGLDEPHGRLPESSAAFLSERSGSAFVGDSDFAGTLLVWDEYNPQDRSFDVLGAHFPPADSAGSFAAPRPAPFLIASGPEFQARPRVAHHLGGRFHWVAWEEGPVGYGHTYRSVDRLWNNATDGSGPLHSWRTVRVAMIAAGGEVFDVPVPMPGFEAAKAAEGRRAGAERLGVFYERPELAFDGQGFLWLGLRHMRQAQLALKAPTKGDKRSKLRCS